jgi:hypothetical protein
MALTKIKSGDIISNLATSRISFVSNTLYIGNTTTNVSINATSFSGVSNDALNLGGTLASAYAFKADTTYIGSTSVALNRSTGALVLNDVSVNGLLTNSVSVIANTLTVNNTVFFGNNLSIGNNTPGTYLQIGNTTVNTYINTTSIAVKAIYANTSNGTSGQVLTSNGTGVYWSTIATSSSNLSTNTAVLTTYVSVGDATVNTYINATSIAVKAIYANTSNGTSGQVLTSNGTGVYWSTVSGGGGASLSTNTATIGDGTSTSFTVTHNLNKSGIVIITKETSSGLQVYPDVTLSTTNTAVLTFVTAPTASQFTAYVLGY